MLTLFSIIISYFISTIIAWFTHYALHCRALGIYKYHLLAHHKHIKFDKHTDLAFVNVIEHLLWLSSLALSCLIAYAVLPSYYSSIFITVFIIYAIVFYYLHDHIHFSNTYLKRFKWFRKIKKYHMLHHRYSGIITFKKPLREECSNIAFGGPMGGKWLDKIFSINKKPL